MVSAHKKWNLFRRLFNINVAPVLFLRSQSGNCWGQALWRSLWWSLTENAIHLLMLQWRLDPTLLLHSSNQLSAGSGSVGGQGGWSLQISHLIGVSKRGEGDWVWSAPQCVRAATTNTKHSTVTTRWWGVGVTAASRKLRTAVWLWLLHPVGIHMRHRSPFPLQCRLFLKWQNLSSNSVEKHGIQSMFNRQITHRHVIKKAASYEPVKHSHRAIIRGLRLGLHLWHYRWCSYNEPFMKTFSD